MTTTADKPDGSLSARRGWVDSLRQSLDRPLTSYYLLVGASGLLLVLGLVMVLSSSSVWSYENYDGDSYAVFLKQLTWVVLAVPFVLVATRLPLPRAEATAAVAEWQQHRGYVDEDVLAFVRDVRAAGRPVGLATNATDRLRADLDLLGLTGEFDHVLNSSELKIHKPAPEYFERAREALGVDAVDERLVRLPPQDEADGVVVGPVPRPFGRVGALERRRQRGRPLVEGRQQAVVRVRTLRLDLLGPLRAGRQHLGPPALDGGQVPEQVGGAPVRARRHTRLGVAPGEHLAEAQGLGADVVEVDGGGQAGVE